MNTEARLAQLVRLRQEIDGEIRRAERRIQDAEGNRIIRKRQKVAQCGTDGGYYRHIRQLRTKPCADCREAHSMAELARRRLRKIREEGAA